MHTIDDGPFDLHRLKYVDTIENSRRLVGCKEPFVIISASGTADAGRVRYHVNSCISNNNCAIVLVVYCGGKFLGGQLLSGSKEAEIFSDASNVLAGVEQMQCISTHGNTDDLLQLTGNQDPEKGKGIFLVHGEHAVQKSFVDHPSIKGFNRIQCLVLHQEYALPLPRVRKGNPIAAQPVTT